MTDSSTAALDHCYLWRRAQESIPEPPKNTSSTFFHSVLLIPFFLCGFFSLEHALMLPLLTWKHAHVQSHTVGGRGWAKVHLGHWAVSCFPNDCCGLLVRVQVFQPHSLLKGTYNSADSHEISTDSEWVTKSLVTSSVPLSEDVTLVSLESFYPVRPAPVDCKWYCEAEVPGSNNNSTTQW